MSTNGICARYPHLSTGIHRKRKEAKEKEERPMTDFSAAHNGKEDGNGTNKKPDVSTCLKYRTFLFVLDRGASGP
jgi:hypothetical protein